MHRARDRDKGFVILSVARRPLWLGRGSKRERGRKKEARRGRGMKGLVSHGGSRHLMLHPLAAGRHCRALSRGTTWFDSFQEGPGCCGGCTVGGGSEAGRPVSVRGEHGLSTVTCPEGKEAYNPPGSGILAATFRGWKRGGRAPQMLQDVLVAEHGGHELPLEPVRLVLKLPLELSPAG